MGRTARLTIAWLAGLLAAPSLAISLVLLFLRPAYFALNVLMILGLVHAAVASVFGLAILFWLGHRKRLNLPWVLGAAALVGALLPVALVVLLNLAERGRVHIAWFGITPLIGAVIALVTATVFALVARIPMHGEWDWRASHTPATTALAGMAALLMILPVAFAWVLVRNTGSILLPWSGWRVSPSQGAPFIEAPRGPVAGFASGMPRAAAVAHACSETAARRLSPVDFSCPAGPRMLPDGAYESWRLQWHAPPGARPCIGLEGVRLVVSVDGGIVTRVVATCGDSRRDDFD